MSSLAPISSVSRTKEEAKASYDKMSSWYDWLSGLSEKKYKEMGLRKLNVCAGETVLEVGFGTGQCLKALAQSVGDSGRVYGIDLSEGMFRIAQARISKAGSSGRVELRCGDATKLPFEDTLFNAIYVSFTLELFDTPEIQVALDECRRVLQDNGRICVVAMSKKEKSGLAVRLYEWAHDRFPKYVDCRPIYVQKALEESGFQTESVTEMSLYRLPIDIVLAKKKIEEKHESDCVYRIRTAGGASGQRGRKTYTEGQ